MAITPNKYFLDPFAISGDRAAVPDAPPIDGSVNYEEGYTPPYELNLTLNPSALPIERTKMNQIFNDITQALQQYQQWGAPNFITTADNDGVPFPYSKNAYALYDDGVNGPRVYQSIVNSNTALPTDSTKWALVDEVNASTFTDGVVNGGMVIGSRQDVLLTSATSIATAKIGLVDAMLAWADGATGGTITQNGASSLGRTGYSLQLNSFSMPISATAGMMHAIESINSIPYKNTMASVSCLVLNDFSSPTDFTIEISKANAFNDFSSTTVVATSAPQTVVNGVETQLVFENISMGDVSNGILITIMASPTGIIVSKNLEFTELQLNVGTTTTAFVYQSETIARAACQRRYTKSYQDSVAVGTVTNAGALAANSADNGGVATANDVNINVLLPVPMIFNSPVIAVYNPVTGGAGTIRGTVGDNANAGVQFTTNRSFVIYNLGTSLTGAGDMYWGHYEVDSELL